MDTNKVESKVGKVITVCIILYILLSLLCLYLPKRVVMTVDKAYWKSNIDIEKYNVYNRVDLILPRDAKLIQAKNEVIGYEEVLERFDYKDSGTIIDGITYYETEPIYSKKPIISTKYYYEIGEWTVDRSIEKIGVEEQPCYAEVTLGSNEKIKDRTIERTLRINPVDLQNIQEGQCIEMLVLGDKVVKWKLLDKDYI